MLTDQLNVCQNSGVIGLERTRFFPRQLIAPEDLTQDQLYFRDRIRRHNRLLHGWGVVCGCEVESLNTPWKVRVKPGYVLDPYGDEILIDRELMIDLRREGLDGNTISPCAEQFDPWCSEVEVERPIDTPLYIAVRYAECQTRPVRVHPAGCGCDETMCEYSRIRDGYAVKVLTHLPDTYISMPPPERSGYYLPCVYKETQPEPIPRPCPPYPPDPWVILADVTVSANGSVSIDQFLHRRYVVTLAGVYQQCDRFKVLFDYGLKWAGFAADLARNLDIMDLSAEPEGRLAYAKVSMRRKDGTLAYVPACFEVEPGETIGELVSREGEREFIDLATNTRFNLRELYALVEVDPHKPLSNAVEALASLEGATLNIENLRSARAGLEGVVDSAGLERLERDYAGAPSAATKLHATDLVGVSSRSKLGEKLAEMTVADVAEMDYEAFLEEALREVPARRRKAVEDQTKMVWTNAARVVELGASLRRIE